MIGQIIIIYRKRGKIRWAKLSRFSRAPQKFSHESLYKLRIMALFKCCNVRYRKSFPAKTTLGGIRESLAQRIFPRLCTYQYYAPLPPSRAI